MTKYVLSGVALLAWLAVVGCGPSLEQQGASTDCLKGCGLKAMTCLETETCIHTDGTLMPCEEECNRVLEDCESGC